MAPDFNDEDAGRVGRRGVSVFDGMHNALYSNPHLREAFKEAKEDGLNDPGAYEYAYREVMGDEYWEENYAERVEEETAEDNE